MTIDAEQLIITALGLPDEDRLEIVEALIASFQSSDQAPFDESWRGVIRERSGELDAGLMNPTPWEHVKRRARESIGG